jgi:hypothetical protein
MSTGKNSRQCAYIILGKSRKTGEYVGYVEQSFTMGWARNRVRVWRTSSSESHRSKKEVLSHMRQLIAEIEAKSSNSNYDLFVYRVGSKNCPVKLNWAQFYKDGGANASKSLWRNLLFTVNGGDRSQA